MGVKAACKYADEIDPCSFYVNVFKHFESIKLNHGSLEIITLVLQKLKHKKNFLTLMVNQKYQYKQLNDLKWTQKYVLTVLLN